jgi:serine protease Do
VRDTRIRAVLFLAAAGAASLPSPAAPADARPAASSLGQLSAEFEGIAARVGPALVQVLVSGYATAKDASGQGLLARERSSGSGVILDPSGYIVTNAHVVEGARRVEVRLARPESGAPGASILRGPGQTVAAQVVGVDSETDLAVLKVAEGGLPALALGDSELLRQGQLVFAFGSPLGLENSVTSGIVSAVARQMRPDDPMIYVQTDASINPGNSGGPLVDTTGRVVGINTMILTQSGGSEGIGFAAPSNIVRTVFEQIRRSGRVKRGQIGVQVQTLTPVLAAGLGLHRSWGVVVADVSPGGPAEAAGLRAADIVLSLDGKALENARQLEVNLYRRSVGETVSLEVLRGTETLTLRVAVFERPDDPDRFADMLSPERNLISALGVLALDLDDKVLALLPGLRARAGVLIGARAGDGLDWQDPLKAGDVVYTLNDASVMSVAALREALGRKKSGDAVVLRIERAGKLRYIAFAME